MVDLVIKLTWLARRFSRQLLLRSLVCVGIVLTGSFASAGSATVLNAVEKSDSKADPGLLVSEAAEQRLRSAIVHYLEQFEQMPQAPESIVPSGPLLEPGDVDNRVGLVRRRLAEIVRMDIVRTKPGTHQLLSNAGSPVFDDELKRGVMQFQSRHGLPPDGRIDQTTVEALNVPLADRLAQMRNNLAQLIQLRRQVTSSRYVLVNIPARELVAVRNRRIELTSTVIVGRPERATPTLHVSIRAVNIHPAWHVPASIVKSDLFPRFSSDPEYFRRRQFVVFDVKAQESIDPAVVISRGLRPQDIRLIQRPWSGNALGRIRIDMPNVSSVYLHDTPLPRLFGWPEGLLSAGCVRVARIVELAGWLISNKAGLNLEPVTESLKKSVPKTLPLAEPIPVHFVYQTAWVNHYDEIQFRPDVYGREKHTGTKLRKNRE